MKWYWREDHDKALDPVVLYKFRSSSGKKQGLRKVCIIWYSAKDIINNQTRQYIHYYFGMNVTWINILGACFMFSVLQKIYMRGVTHNHCHSLELVYILLIQFTFNIAKN